MSNSDLNWFKSSYSSNEPGSDCVEVAYDWFKSSYSSNEDDTDCVEVAHTPDTVHVRDSKQPDTGRLTVRTVAWSAFVAHAAEH
ncbi:DUF397 domain-containing protein [Streptomyces sp. YIM 130001]|uniref:DUF397 domain-containing protein n=1 Tax=Streptomyces sp. YIM 130001 TaxID=2259644 RepID=UPI000E64C34C|nr:DUF397 domain-containing protein [Streptomyces sp. YIM 130001]